MAVYCPVIKPLRHKKETRRMSRKTVSSMAMTFVIAMMSMCTAFAALHLEGQSGVFLNALAYPVAASKTEISSHSVNLDSLGTVSTYNLSFGLKENVELGITRIASSVTGVSDQNLILGKWQFAGETEKSPALAAWGIYRDLVDGDSSVDLGLSATKIVTVSKRPLVLDLGVRNTKAQGLGLFGFADDREWRLEGSFAYFITPRFAAGAEFKQQVNGDTWKDIAFRYVASDKWNIDAGVANLGDAIDNQVALAVTRVW
jgi:hypothetical protein